MFVVVYDAVITTNLSLYVKMLCMGTCYLLNITYYNTYYEALPNKRTLFKLNSSQIQDFNVAKAFIGPFYGIRLVEIAMATVRTKIFHHNISDQSVSTDWGTVLLSDRAQDCSGMRRGGLCVYNIDACCSHTVKVDGRCFPDVELLIRRCRPHSPWSRFKRCPTCICIFNNCIYVLFTNFHLVIQPCVVWWWINDPHLGSVQM